MSGAYVQLTNHIGAFAVCPLLCFLLWNWIFIMSATQVVYGIFLSFGELGPGNCTLLLAAKCGPTAVRGQYFGVAAAVGKVGALVGTWGTVSFPPFYHHNHNLSLCLRAYALYLISFLL